MRVAVWNIERGYQPNAIVRQLQAVDADLYLLSELDCGNLRTAWVDMFAVIQESLQMPGHFACEFRELQSPWRFLVPVGGPGGGVHGNAIFSRLPMTNYREVRLPTNAALNWSGETIIPELFEPRDGGRIAQHVDITWCGRTISVVNTHLENWRSSWSLRSQQLQSALSACRQQLKIVGGDFNPIERAWLSLPPMRKVPPEIHNLRAFLQARGLYDPFANNESTFHSFQMDLKLDWLAVSRQFLVTQRQNIKTAVSDHNMLLVDLELS